MTDLREIAELVRSDLSGPGIQRRRCGRGFRYLGPDGASVRDADILARIRALVIPPAWEDVWICADAQGHIQAVGTDAAGRRQYRYHDLWREQRDREARPGAGVRRGAPAGPQRGAPSPGRARAGPRTGPRGRHPAR